MTARKLSPAERRQRRIAAEAKRHSRCPDDEHDWRAGDSFGMADGQRCVTWQCSRCLRTWFQYQDRGDRFA